MMVGSSRELELAAGWVHPWLETLTVVHVLVLVNSTAMHSTAISDETMAKSSTATAMRSMTAAAMYWLLHTSTPINEATAKYLDAITTTSSVATSSLVSSYHFYGVAMSTSSMTMNSTVYSYGFYSCGYESYIYVI